MQPTKYPPASTGIPSCALYAEGAHSIHAYGPSRPGVIDTGAAGGDAPGARSALDLIEEHLTYIPQNPEYRRVETAGRLMEGWYVPQDFEGASDLGNYVLKVQPFAKGGYEATVRFLDLQKINAAMERSPIRGKREEPEEPSVESQLKAGARAKRKVRLLTKNMMASHLVTFTKRETVETGYWTTDDWAKAWDKFRRNLTRIDGEFPYVAVLEKHQKGNFHLHVAWCGRVNVKLVRRLWLACIGGGAGCGNIDAKHIKVPHGGDRAARIARYISKYVTKTFETDARFNKKRYWHSRQSLEDARRYVLKAASLDAAMAEMVKMLSLDMSRFMVMDSKGLRLEDVFAFPDGGGLWLAYIPDKHGGDPPF